MDWGEQVLLLVLDDGNQAIKDGECKADCFWDFKSIYKTQFTNNLWILRQTFFIIHSRAIMVLYTIIYIYNIDKEIKDQKK